jgi:Ca2+/Na+ antiporter
VIHTIIFVGIIKKVYFYLVLVVVLIIFLYNQILAIWLATFIFIIYFSVFFITVSSKKNLLKSLQEYLLISDTEIAKKLQRRVDDIRRDLFSLAKNQKKKKWLIVYLNKRYLFLNMQAVEIFIQLYSRGFNEKQIFENLQPRMNIKSRAEVKAIQNTLANQNRLVNSEYPGQSK